MSIVFVFGSNLAGRHGKGAALYAKQFYGAIYGQGIGRQGNSYAIPTKDSNLKTLSLDVINHHISDFIAYAKYNSKDTFMLTPIGTGLAGYSREQIYSLLKQFDVPSNVLLTKEWLNL
jgi:hypothetical protein